MSESKHNNACTVYEFRQHKIITHDDGEDEILECDDIIKILSKYCKEISCST